MQEQPSPHRSPRRLVKGLVLLLVLAVCMVFLVYAPIFTLQHISLDGTQQLKEQDVWQIAGARRGEPLFTVKTDDITHRLEEDLRVEHATVRRVLPDTLAVHIEERRALASVATDYGYADIDQTGKIIAARRSLGQMKLPLITGYRLHEEYLGDDIEDDTVKRVLTFLARLSPEAIASLSEVAILGEGQITAYTAGAVQIRLGSLDRIEAQAKLTQGFLEDQKTATHPVEYVDFTYESPFIKLKQ